jgi:hypothetical protein
MNFFEKVKLLAFRDPQIYKAGLLAYRLSFHKLV